MALVSDPTNQKLLDRLGIISVKSLTNETSSVHTIKVWEKDLIGPGGFAKGYYYNVDTPPSSSLVDRIDETYNSHPADQGTFYYHVKGPWYLYYTATN